MLRDDALLNESAAPTAREIDRRTIAKGVAWTVPVVIVATAAPAAAGSANPSPTTTFVSSTGHQNGLSVNANFTLFFTGSASSTVEVTGLTERWRHLDLAHRPVGPVGRFQGPAEDDLHRESRPQHGGDRDHHLQDRRRVRADRPP